jgi:hypothetical protein
MTPKEVLDHARYLTHSSTTDNTGGDTDLLRILNDYVYRMVTKIVSMNEDKYGRKAYTSLSVSANQENYALPDDCMRIKRLEISYDGTSWRKVTTHDDGQVEAALDPTTISQDYSTSAPYADIYGNCIYLRPIPATQISLGLKLWYIRRPGAITNITGGSIDLPGEYHGYLTNGVASEIFKRKGEQTMAGMMFQEWENGLKKVEEQFSPYNLDIQLDLYQRDLECD